MIKMFSKCFIIYIFFGSYNFILKFLIQFQFKYLVSLSRFFVSNNLFLKLLGTFSLVVKSNPILIRKSFFSIDFIPSVFLNSSLLLERFRDFKLSTCFSVCFSKAFPKEEYVNLACSFICLRLKGNVSSPVSRGVILG